MNVYYLVHLKNGNIEEHKNKHDKENHDPYFNYVVQSGALIIYNHGLDTVYADGEWTRLVTKEDTKLQPVSNEMPDVPDLDFGSGMSVN